MVLLKTGTDARVALADSTGDTRIKPRYRLGDLHFLPRLLQVATAADCPDRCRTMMRVRVFDPELSVQLGRNLRDTASLIARAVEFLVRRLA